MKSYPNFRIGEEFTSPERALDQDLATTFIKKGGYTHPLFNDPEFAAKTPLGQIPFPGEATLLVMGGLVEQTERFGGDTIALVGLDDVKFKRPALPGDRVRVRLTVKDKKETSSKDRGLVIFDWTCLNQRDEILISSIATMMFSL